MQLYLDADGVLADFDKRATEVLGMPPREWEEQNGSEKFWDTLYATPNFFLDMVPMPDAYVLYDAVAYLKPIILTGCPRGDWAQPQKFAWRDKYFPGVQMICVPSTNKVDFCKPGDIIIDDWPKHMQKWIDAGGIWILHKNAEDSIRQLNDLGIPTL
jgi:hypothetical protein